MKNQYVESLQEGDRLNDYFVASRKDLRDQQNGSKFLGMVFKDRTGEIGGILWNNAVSISKLFEVGDVVKVKGSVTSYQNRLQVRVEEVLPLREGEYNIEDLLVMPADSDKVFGEFLQIMQTVENKWLASLIGSFMDDDAFVADFKNAAAGKKWHHAQPGGLLTHCLEVARLAQATCSILPGIDRDVLLTCVFLHDLGKIWEMSHGLHTDYTTEGKLIGHLAMAAQIVGDKIRAIDGFPENLRLQVLHCILAHHGELVNGSPVVPKTVEALVLFHLDNLDAQVDAYNRVVKETSERGQDWSEYIGLIERPIWTKLDPA